MIYASTVRNDFTGMHLHLCHDYGCPQWPRSEFQVVSRSFPMIIRISYAYVIFTLTALHTRYIFRTDAFCAL